MSTPQPALAMPSANSRTAFRVLGAISASHLINDMRHCKDLEEALFIQMTMADDRAIEATYVSGRLAYERPRQQHA